MQPNNPSNTSATSEDMTPESPEPGTMAGENPGAGNSAGRHLWTELERAHQLAAQVSDWGGAMLGLLRLELVLALQSLPRILALSLALLPLAGLTWISLSLLLAWLAYAASGIVSIGLTTLFALQLGLLLLCYSRLKKLRAQSGFPETRQQWRLFLANLNGEQEDTAGENSAENRS
jgi:uncharacterized membrane protein YqjE